jgi:hypothetical protein
VSRRAAARSRTKPAAPPREESPLDWLRRRRDGNGRPLIGEAAFAAGERLRRDFTFGQMTPRVTVNWDASGVGAGPSGGRGPAELSDNALAARQRLQHALGAVGPELRGVLLDVCCFLKGIEEVERERGWPPRSAKVVLGLALERLARHYGFADEAVGAGRRGRIEAWGAPDYRPRIDGGEE